MTKATKSTETSAATSIGALLASENTVGSDVVTRQVKLANGKEHTMYFHELSAWEWKKHLENEQSKDAKVRSESTARLLSKCVLEVDGRRALTVEQATKLKPAVSGALFMTILEVAGVVPPAAKQSGEDDGDEAVVVGESESGN